MPLTKDKINDIWWSGFCAETVRMSAKTDLDDDRDQRVKWMMDHIPTCLDCQNAGHLKGIELEVAERIGPQARNVFANGKNIMVLEGAQQAMSFVLRMRMAAGDIDADFIIWMEKMTLRHGKDFDG